MGTICWIPSTRPWSHEASGNEDSKRKSARWLRRAHVQSGYRRLNSLHNRLTILPVRLLDQLRAVHQHPLIANKVGEPRASAEHPVVYVHPESRRKALLISPAFTTDLIGLTADESEALIDFLCRHCTRPEFTYRHHWRINDLMVWDDRCSLHYNISDYSGDGAVAAVA